jgi:hypothetical protein
VNTDERDTWVATALEVVGTVAEVAGMRLGGPVAIVAAAVKALTWAASTAIRDQGRSVDEIIESIAMPPALDTSFQAEVDARIRGKPP